MSERELIFRGSESGAWLLIFAAAAVAAALLIVALMRYERLLVPKRTGYALLALRLLVVLAVFIIWLEPVSTTTVEQTRRGRIRVAVDLSESMESLDDYAASAEKLRWARGTGMIGNRDNQRRLDRWAADYEAGREPEWVEPDETRDPQHRQQLAAVRKQNLQEVFAELDRLSRKQIVRRLITEASDPLTARLGKSADVEYVFFAGDSQPVDSETLQTGEWEMGGELSANASDLSQVLSGESRDAEDSPLLGVVLLTDGRHNTGRDPVSAAGRLGEQSVPIYPVLVGTGERPKDLSIASIDAPQQVFVGDRPRVTVTLNTQGFQDEAVTVHLESKGEEPQSRTVTASQDETSLEFELPAAALGRHEYTVHADPRPDETREDNNSQTFTINVVDDRAHVLVLDGEARWEFRFLDNAFSRDERVDVQRVVFRQPYLGVLHETYFPSELQPPDDPEAASGSPFTGNDLVIVGDVSTEDCPDTVWEQLEDFVSESGGTVAFVAGKRQFPLAHRSPALDRLLPMTGLRPRSFNAQRGDLPPTERGVRWQLTPEGESLAVLQLHADPDQNREIWRSLPGHTWGLIGRAKPAATVLARVHAADVDLGIGDEDVAEEADEEESPIFVRQNFGYGQVFWIGVDSTWRWRLRQGDTYHHRFWGQLARLAAETKTAASHPAVRFAPAQNEADAGEPVILRAHWTRKFLERFPQLKAEVEIYRDGAGAAESPETTVELKAADDRPLLFDGRVDSLPAGRYTLKLTVENATLDSDAPSAPLVINERKSRELSDVTANRALLDQLARASGGRLFLPDALHQLPELFEETTSTSVLTDEIALWDHWAVLLALFALLTCEWAVRKLSGLP